MAICACAANVREHNGGMDKRPIDFPKYPIRTCRSLLGCDPCGESITLGQAYYDGGYGRRAHVACVRPVSPQCTPDPALAYIMPEDEGKNVRGWMGGDIACGADVDDADRCPECEECRGKEYPCARCMPNTPPITPMHEGMGRVPPVPPTTVAEWVAQTQETGILEFDQLLAIAVHEGSGVKDMKFFLVREFPRELELLTSVGSDNGDPILNAFNVMRLVNCRAANALAFLAELCSAVETHPLDRTNGAVENARKQARDFLEANK